MEWQSCESGSPCRPPQGLSLRFNNPVDEKSFDEKRIRVSPPIKEMQMVARGTYLSIMGRTKGMTTYTVTLPGGLKDTFGQTLGADDRRTFHFREAHPQLMSQYEQLTVLDPRGDQTFRVFSINRPKLRVTIRKVQPKDWKAFQEYNEKIRWSKEEPPPPGTLWKEWTQEVKGAMDELTETAIPLRPALNKAGHGQLVVQVTQWPLPEKKHERQMVIGWVQATNLAVDAFADHSQLLAWVSRLQDGSPVKGASVQILGAGAMASGDSGLAKLPLPEEQSSEKRILVASTKDDLVMLPESLYRWGRTQWTKRAPPGERATWFVFDDRKLYKPKEEVRLKGFVRLVNMGAQGGVRLLPAGDNKVSFTVFDPRRNKIGDGTVPVDPLGGFDLAFTLPDNANLGYARVQLNLQGEAYGSTSHSFQIQEFKRPEFEVVAQGSKGPHVVGGHADVEVTASYFAGGGLPGAKVRWEVTTAEASFTPPNQSGFTFVGWRPSWGRHHVQAKTVYLTQDGVTDGKGKDRLRIHFDRVDPARPWTVRAAATITDVSRRTWTANQALLVHPSRYYVGLRTERSFVHRGTPMKVQVIVTDLEGKAVAGQVVSVQAVRQTYRYRNNQWGPEEADPQSCRVTSAEKAVICTFGKPRRAGSTCSAPASRTPTDAPTSRR